MAQNTVPAPRSDAANTRGPHSFDDAVSVSSRPSRSTKRRQARSTCSSVTGSAQRRTSRSTFSSRRREAESLIVLHSRLEKFAERLMRAAKARPARGLGPPRLFRDLPDRPSLEMPLKEQARVFGRKLLKRAPHAPARFGVLKDVLGDALGIQPHER